MAARQWRNGSVHPIAISGADSSQIVTGSDGRLLLRVYAGCFAQDSLAWFNPADSSLQYMLHAPKNVMGVQAAVPYGRPLTS